MYLSFQKNFQKNCVRLLKCELVSDKIIDNRD
jgi:hypothetical protein